MTGTLNGIRDEDVGEETPLEDVTATLFKKNSSGQYEVCKTDVTGANIKHSKTDANGAYSFDKLAAGDYIVAFSGAALKPYTSATVYQQNGANDSNTNDGKAISKLTASGIDEGQYAYFIQYSVGSESMTLHSINEMGSVILNNGVEEFSHQDLGVIIAGYELPETGGTGTLPYTAGGILLIIAALLVWGFTRRRKQYR